jgi:thioredoxin-like negative regulator of GroEL
MTERDTVQKKDAEEQIFSLRKKMELCARANNTDEIARLQTQIAQLQKKSGAVTGTERKSHERGN